MATMTAPTATVGLSGTYGATNRTDSGRHKHARREREEENEVRRDNEANEGPPNEVSSLEIPRKK